jgi:hypothetical protein
MSDEIDLRDAMAGREDELSVGNTFERQILMISLAPSLRFGLMVAAVVLAARALSPA